MKTSLFTLPFFLLTACSGTGLVAHPVQGMDTGTTEDIGGGAGGDNGSGDGSGNNDSEGSGSPEFQPTDGNWSYGREEIEYDSCNMGDETMEESTLAMANISTISADTFTLVHRQGEESCTLYGTEFTCMTRQETDTTPQDFGIDAVMTLTFNTSGTFASEDSMTYQIDVGVECEGWGCGIIEVMKSTTMPCEMTIGADLSLSE